jgi:hypothetical protein
VQPKEVNTKIISLNKAIITHMSYLKRDILFETFFEAKAKIKQDYLKKCNDAHVCMLVLNFKNLGMLQTKPLKMKLTLEHWNG